MKKALPYEVDHISGTIYLTKAFAKEASTLNTPEYKAILTLRHDNPTYKIEMREIAKKKNKKTYKNLTEKNMRIFIENIKDTKRSVEDRIADFKTVKELSKSQSSPYSYLKRWFFKEYGDAYRSTYSDDNWEQVTGK